MHSSISKTFKLIALFAVFLVSFISSVSAQVVSQALPATGAETTTSAGAGIVQDLRWTRDAQPAYVTAGQGWWTQYPDCTWISGKSIEYPTGGYVDYSLVFNLPAGVTNIHLEGKFSVTGYVQPRINGKDTSLWNIGAIDYGRTQPFDFHITSGFVVGDNVLTLRVFNSSIAENALVVPSLLLRYEIAATSEQVKTLRDVRLNSNRRGDTSRGTGEPPDYPKYKFFLPGIDSGKCITISIAVPGVKKGDKVEVGLNTKSQASGPTYHIATNNIIEATFCNYSDGRIKRTDEDENAELIVYKIN